MDRRKFIKIFGGSVALAPVIVKAGQTGINLEDYKKNVINPAAKVLADGHEHTIATGGNTGIK